MLIKSKIKILPVVGLIAVPVMLAGLAYAATIFPPTVNPAVVGYVAQPVLSKFSLLSNTEKIYRGEYEKGGWSGNLSCYPVSNTGVVNVAAPCWSAGSAVGAASVVDKQGFADGSRNIATRNATGGVAFSFSVNTAVLLDKPHADFIRGDRSQEAPAGALRTRQSVLGDTIHSRPYYHADATNPTVFYGANDGMMHAIDAVSGAERWAYIPSMLIPKLPKLWAGAYAHENFVDGNVNVTNVGTPSAPQNILVGVLGSGGKGIYALDVTNLTALNDAAVASKSLWEITPASAGYANLGDTYSNPTLYPVETGASAVIVGNGYNNTGNGMASLFVIDTKTGALIREISTGSGTPASPNGLSTPVAIDVNNNGRADFAYAGDIDGNIWKFDLSKASPSAWSVSLLYSTKNNAATPAGQAITMMPGVARHPSGGYMVTFATGRILTAADQADTAVHYAYGIWDGAPAANATLAAQTITVRPYGTPAVNVRVVGTSPEGATITPNYAAGKDRGWQASLPAGERVVGDSAFIQYGRFFFNATNPTVKYTPTGWPINSGSGENWLMELDYLTGSAYSPFFDMNGDGVLNIGDRISYVAGDVITAPNTVGSPITTNFGVPVGFLTSNGVQSQPILGGLGALTALFYNQNFDGTPAPLGPVIPPGATGIGGGHFDTDIWFHATNNSLSGATQTTPGPSTATRSSSVGVQADYSFRTHYHQYDKNWDVNGVNILNPSASTLWLGNAVDTKTPYKVLVFNQAWNRAAEVQVGSTTWISTKNYQTKLGLKVADLPTYTGNTEDVPALGLKGTGNIMGLQVRMPYNAFSVLDWWGDGIKMNGLMPEINSCVYDKSNNLTGLENPVSTSSANRDVIGPNGERNDGALTIQVIRADTPDTAIELNTSNPVIIAGKSVPAESFGYRVKVPLINKYVISEHAVYWHHPTNPCLGDTQTVNSGQAAVAAVAGTPDSCSNGTTVIVGTQSCTTYVDSRGRTKTGNFTAGTPSTPAYPAVLGWTGWTSSAPPDTKVNTTTPSIRPVGSNDPHNASFIPNVGGVGGAVSGGGAAATPPVGVAIPISLIGGTPAGVVKPPVSCVAGSPGCTCVGRVCTAPASSTTTGVACVAGSPGCVCVTDSAGKTVCSKPSVIPTCGSLPLKPCPQDPKQPRTGRLSWRELIN